MKIRLYFKPSDLCIDDKPVPQNIIDKIVNYHIVPMSVVRHYFGKPIFCKDSKGKKSGFRPYRWEILRNRSGKSQHTFGQGKNGIINPKDKGAVDWRCRGFQSDKDELLKLIMEHTEYTRIAIYNHFLHCDYKPTSDGKRQLFKSSDNSEWTFIKNF